MLRLVGMVARLSDRLPNLKKRKDRLASYGHSQDVDFVIHSVPPVELVSFVEADYHGVACNKLCPEFCPFS